MPVDTFTKEEFEKVLDTIGKWHQMGVYGLEYRYAIQDDKSVCSIMVNSSINSFTKVSDSSGENSIRVWLAYPNGKPVIGKLQKWITRVPGWDRRMGETIKKLMNIGQQVHYCNKCKKLESVFVVKKEGVNKGRLFKRCECENSFQWVME